MPVMPHVVARHQHKVRVSARSGITGIGGCGNTTTGRNQGERMRGGEQQHLPGTEPRSAARGIAGRRPQSGGAEAQGGGNTHKLTGINEMRPRWWPRPVRRASRSRIRRSARRWRRCTGTRAPRRSRGWQWREGSAEAIRKRTCERGQRVTRAASSRDALGSARACAGKVLGLSLEMQVGEHQKGATGCGPFLRGVRR